MIFSLPAPIVAWTLVLWGLGWLVLPVARRVFPNLPDGGLAVGRVAFVVLAALPIFWGATARLLPLTLAPAVAGLFVLMGAAGWRAQTMRVWARLHWKSLLVSDAIFLLSWAAFLWLRLRHPELNDLEKPMDAALLSAAWKANYLPFAHPWWGGANFTNYYYFGPLMGALMGRALGTPPHVAYNLVQPAFCAFFLSSAWALGAALTRSRAWGVAVMLLVGLSGPLEPLRQWSEKGWTWPFNWWTTARVIPDTINEYPAFTLAAGDAHAHFYALSLAVLWLCLAWSLFAEAPKVARVTVPLVIPEAVSTEAPIADAASVYKAASRGKGKKKGKKKRTKSAVKAEVAPEVERENPPDARNETASEIVYNAAHKFTRRGAIIGIGGLILGAWLMTNTWDAPVFGLLFAVAIGLSRPASQPNRRTLLAMMAPFVIALGAAALYLWKYKSTVGGAQLDIWLPDPFSFGLLWGGWIVLGAFSLLLPVAPQDGDDQSAKFRRLLIGVGLVALVAPFLFYVRGTFGDGDLRHQDTVFKFGLQAWVLLGFGISAELGARLLKLSAIPKLIVASALLLVAPVLALSSASTIWTRAVTLGTAQMGVSLDGMRQLPLAEQRAIVWLQQNGRAGEVVMEGVPLSENGLPGGDYDGYWGRVGTFSGLSSTLCWPQHVWGWDGNYDEVMERGDRVMALYRLPSALQTARGATALGARYSFFGRGEMPWQTPSLDEARAAGFALHEFAGEDDSRALILERIGR